MIFYYQSDLFLIDTSETSGSISMVIMFSDLCFSRKGQRNPILPFSTASFLMCDERWTLNFLMLSGKGSMKYLHLYMSIYSVYMSIYCLFIVCIQRAVNYAISFILFLLFCLEFTLYLSILFGECIVLHSTVLALLLSCFVMLFAHWDGYVWYCKPCVVFCDARGMVFQPSV